MNRGEFLQGLQNALSGNIPPEAVRENLNYYNNYIRDEMGKGRSEEEVMGELGDPRLIARTILDTTPGAGEGIYEEYRFFDSFAGGAGMGGARRQESDSAEGSSAEDLFGGRVHYFDLSKWYWKLFAIVAVILVVAVVITIVTGLLALLIPILPIIIVVMFLLWFIRSYGG